MSIAELLYAIRNLTDRVWVWLGGSHLIAPTAIGSGKHDCALVSLYWAAPCFPEDQIFEASRFVCRELALWWSYEQRVRNCVGGSCVPRPTTLLARRPLGALLDKKPGRCVALLHGHFISIVNGKIVGPDARLAWRPNTKVYCYWTFSP